MLLLKSNNSPQKAKIVQKHPKNDFVVINNSATWMKYVTIKFIIGYR